MITTFIIAAVLATIIIGVNPRNPSLRWLSASLYTTSFMILVFLLDIEYPDAPNLLMNTMFFITDTTLAYTFGIFGVVYSELFNKKSRRTIMLAGLMLIGVVWMLTPLTPTRRINYEGYNELPVVVFIVLFLTLGIVFLIKANIMEKHPYKRIERLLTNLLIVPTMLCIAGGYIFYVFEIDLFRFNYIFAICFLLLYIMIGVKQGALGVKIKVEMLKSDASIQLLKSGSSILNHTIKNEIGKIDILIHQMRHSFHNKNEIRRSSDKELDEMLTMAADSVHHVQTMMTKINERVQAIEVNLKKENMLPVVEQCLERFEKTFGERVSIRRNLETVSEIYIDSVHIKEVIQNILINAVESMEGSGEITVVLKNAQKEVVLQIQDAGNGIPKESVPVIFEPFYSTKNMRSNYGLGLFYCKNVMTKHMGSIHVESIPGKGSSFYLCFRRQKVL